ncbi:MAG: coenzyme A pyrophosphatase [Bacteroidetes bacterium]|nr:MAG: coenzyme A pyrophosphatase [Bacteroidota bacterium]
MDFNKFIISISKVKKLPLPAQASQFKMSPPFRLELIEMHKEKMKNASRAGVMALFYPDKQQQTKMVLILRNTYNGVHSAQIGFPGGKFEAQDDSLEKTAKRETFEEIGIPVQDIEVFKQLTEVYIPPSNFYVQPFLGIIKETPTFKKQDDEVEEIIEILLYHFINDDNVISTPVETSYNINVEVPAYKLNGHIVWGATAMMLSEIKDLLKNVM